jgi:PAS domain-containing protein
VNDLFGYDEAPTGPDELRHTGRELVTSRSEPISARSSRGIFMQKLRSTRSWAYGAATPALAVAFLLRWQLGPKLIKGSPYLIYLPAIVIAAYFDGLWTGLLVTFVAAIAANAPLAEPPRTYLVKGASDWIALALFALSGALISGLGESLRRVRRHNLGDERRRSDQAFHEAEKRNRSEAALRESEERFRGTFENAGVGIGHFDFEGRWLRVNQRQCDILGYTREEILRTSIQGLAYLDDLG